MIIKAGFCQFKPDFMQVEKNLTKMVQMISLSKADLIVFPELATCGYSFKNCQEVEKVAENCQHGLTAMILKKAAWEYNCSIVAGFPESHQGNLYNSALLVNPDGSQFVYRKIHLFLNEKKFFSPGNLGFLVAPAKFGVKLGIMICFDWFFPEAARTLMLNGAQIIAHPANLVLPWCQQAMITRSLENHIFSITANRTGREVNGPMDNSFTGMSQIVSPLGSKLSAADCEQEICSVLDIDTEESLNKQITELNNISQDRKPEFYHS